MRHWRHWGFFHWFSSCWHKTTESYTDPGHGIEGDRTLTDTIWKCCKCGRTKPYTWI